MKHSGAAVRGGPRDSERSQDPGLADTVGIFASGKRQGLYEQREHVSVLPRSLCGTL